MGQCPICALDRARRLLRYNPDSPDPKARMSQRSLQMPARAQIELAHQLALDTLDDACAKQKWCDEHLGDAPSVAPVFLGLDSPHGFRALSLALDRDAHAEILASLLHWLTREAHHSPSDVASVLLQYGVALAAAAGASQGDCLVLVARAWAERKG